MQLRILTASDVRAALKMDEAIDAMKVAYSELSKGNVQVPLRSRIDIAPDRGTTLFMPALIENTNDLALKLVSIFSENIQLELPTIHALVTVIDARTGQPRAILEGGSLTAIRTGAGSGAATDLLAREDANTVAVYGSGVQARTQLEAVCTVRDIEQAWVYSIDSEGTQRFARELSGKGPIPPDIRIAQDAQEPLAHADIICTATTSRVPVFSGAEIRDGTHINAIGAFTPDMQEIDSATVKRAHVVVDSREAALAEAGDLIIPINAGEISEDWIRSEIGEIINGTSRGRENPEQITLFKSVGVAVQDAIAAGRALQKAEELGLGQVITL
jgi:ornithine cyclodeaminase